MEFQNYGNLEQFYRLKIRENGPKIRNKRLKNSGIKGLKTRFKTLKNSMQWPKMFLIYRVVYSISDLYVNGSGPITSVGEERANLSAVVYL